MPPREPREVEPSPLPPAPLLRIVPDEGTELVWVVDGEGRIEHAGPLALTMIGYPPEELAGVSLPSLVHPEELEELEELLREAAEGRSPGLAMRVRRRDGGWVWLGTTARGVRDAERTRIQLVSRDISERKHTEEELKRLSRENRLILDSVGDGICGLDLEGRVTFQNPAASRILGYEPGELAGKCHHETFHHSRSGRTAYPAGECPVFLTLREGTVQQVDDDVFWRRDGTPIPVEYCSTPALDEGRIVGAVLVFRDITHRREIEAALRRSEWLAGIGQTVLTLRHEINNPLTSMLADAALLDMEGNTAEEVREMVQSIVRQAWRIRDVVHRLAERKDAPSLRQVGSSHMLDLSAPPAED